MPHRRRAKRWTYGDAIGFLYGLAPRGVKLGLDRMHVALARVGSPERSLAVVHVAGTNGKGSVAAMVAGALRAAGHRTGLYTSPHLHRFVERIRIDGRCIGDRKVTKLVAALADAMSEPDFPELSFFEAATIVALTAFRDASCDVAVLEVGLGGRLDATNVIHRPLATVITRLALDHEEMLGETLHEIALEKAGIMRPGVPVVCSVRGSEALDALSSRAAELDAPFLVIDRDFKARPSRRRGRIDVSVGDVRVEDVHPALRGAHQVDNAACAIATCVAVDRAGLRVPERAMRLGVERVRWPGRLEWIRGRPRVLLDAAHNPDGCAALAAYLSARKKKARCLVFGAMEDKHAAGMIEALDGIFESRFYVAARTPRSADPETFVEYTTGEVERSIPEAIARAKRAVGPDGEVVVTGSIFVVAEARAALLDVPAEPPITM
jgi:dihydrofolate synthase/folylpolyglutamate synthase